MVLGSSDHHQIRHSAGVTPRGDYRGTGSDVIEPEVTSWNRKSGKFWSWNRPIATKFGMGIEGQQWENIRVPEVRSWNQKLPRYTGSKVIIVSVGLRSALKLGRTCIPGRSRVIC